jgi:hypothetical protein
VSTQISSTFYPLGATPSGMPRTRAKVVATKIIAISSDGSRVLEKFTTDDEQESMLNRLITPAEQGLLGAARTAAQPLQGIASSGWLAVP